MKLRYKILGGVAVVLAAGVVALALAMSYTAPCGASPAPPAGATLMKGIVRRCYGPPDILRYEDVAKPAPADDEVLVRVHAASVNPLDWHYVEGTPYLVRIDSGFGKPDNPRLGVDFAGTVEAVGRSVRRFKPGDEVFGGKLGSFAQYLTVREERAITLKPANVSFEQAASVPIAAITALQALRDKGHVKAGQKVLINGASGGVGTFAVQIARSFGAEVTGVCSTKNVELVRSLGADHVVDYTREDFTKGAERYDLIIDNVGTHSVADYRHVLNPNGNYVMIGSATTGHWFGWLEIPLEARILSPFMSQKFGMMLAELNKDDLAVLSELLQSGKVTPVIDRTYKLSEAPEALRYLEKGHARGKVVLSVD
ncbi:MAG TPA: NAD(P)-dependent alcohol dehydrogenase [Steroidobacteraceae bacterium]|nr:NAD(P)-dependent alcohol dehydrogenase [Steroidobacteraceae bacterium]